jgi:deoxyribonuclease-4
VKRDKKGYSHLKIGFHISIQGSLDRSVDRAVELGCDTFQIFTRNPRSWKFSELDPMVVQKFKEKLGEHRIAPVFGHTPYLLNLSSPKEVYSKSVESLIADLRRCGELEIPYLVTHLGSHLGAGIQVGIRRVVSAINEALSQVDNEVVLLVEIAAGSRNVTGSKFEELREVVDGLSDAHRLGICLDTCHCFAAGYDLRTTMAVEGTLKSFDNIVGLSLLKLVHLNDSKAPLGSQVDRHEHIGLGMIGEEGFRSILRSPLGERPLILETPFSSMGDDKMNLLKVKQLAGLLPI